MKAERDIERKIRAKEEEAQGLRVRLDRAEAYIEGLKESLRLLHRTVSDNGAGTIRPNSQLDKARKVLRAAGEPMHVSDILSKMGFEPTKMKRVSLSGSLGFYVRQNYIFTRPAPNTFGLMEFGDIPDREGNVVPAGFGKDV